MYINTEGKRYPKQIFDRLSEEEQATFVEVDDETYDSLLIQANENSSYLIVENGEIVLKPYEIETEDSNIVEKRELQAYLDSTDYMSIKCFERGLDMETEYPDDYTKRQEARDRINEINSILES